MLGIHRLSKSPHFKSILLVSFFILSALIWISIKIYGHYYLSTDDAYINANMVQISPRITGRVEKLYVNNNQYVKQGQRLFTLDATPFEIAVQSAKAQVQMAEADVGKSLTVSKRTLSLVKQRYSSLQEGDNATASLKAAQGQLEFVKAGLRDALLNLTYTNVMSPTDGWIANLSLRTGDVIAANQPLFVIISNDVFWVDANFKETEMAHIKVGQIATIVSDLYPDHPFKGVVESISGGAGSVFSLLPPQNATGNWVKVTQRVPVRIRILNPDQRYQLRIGTTATITLHLQQFLNA